MMTDKSLSLYITALTLLSLVSIFNPHLDLILPLSLILIMAGVTSIYASSGAKRGIHVERIIEYEKVEPGNKVKVSLTVYSKRTLYIRVYDVVPQGLVVDGKPYGEGLVKPRSPLQIEYYVTPMLSGWYEWRNVVIEVMDPLRMFKYITKLNLHLCLEATGKPTIIPRSIPIQKHIGQTIKRREPYIDHVREYTIGDSLKLIVPKSIIKHRVPKVKVLALEYEVTQKPIVHILLILGPWFAIDKTMLNKLVYIVNVLSAILLQHINEYVVTVLFKKDKMTAKVTELNIDRVINSIRKLQPLENIRECKDNITSLSIETNVLYIVSDPYTLLKVAPLLSEYVKAERVIVVSLTPILAYHVKGFTNIMERLLNEYHGKLDSIMKKTLDNSELVII